MAQTITDHIGRGAFDILNPKTNKKVDSLTPADVNYMERQRQPAPKKVAVYSTETTTDNTSFEDRMAELQRQQQQAVDDANARADEAAAKQAAAEAAAKKAGKDKAGRENDATASVVDSLVKSLTNYAKGRDTQYSNAKKNFDTSLSGILSQYNNAAKDANEYADRNEQDYDSKSVSNTTNMVRESNDLLEQALSTGAGETDTLKALQQAARQFDNNQADVASSFQDTLRSINSQLNGANSTAENNRLNAWQQQQEARASAFNDYNKNMADTWTNIQRTEAGNTNIDSDYSVGFQNRYGDDDKVKANDEISKYTGKTYAVEKAPEGWAANWEGKQKEIRDTARLGNRAAAVSVGTLKRAEGASLRKW